MPEEKVAPSIIQHAHLYGLREDKYHILQETDVTTTSYTEVTPCEPYYFYTPQEVRLKLEYECGISLTSAFGTGTERKDQGLCWGLGVVTHNDGLLVGHTKAEVERRFELLESNEDDAMVAGALGLANSVYWSMQRERQKVREYDWRAFLVPYLYRPFNLRWISYQPNLMEIGRGGASKVVMGHLLRLQNIAILTTRQTRESFGVLASRYPSAHKSVSSYDGTYVFPLYRTTGAVVGNLFNEESCINLSTTFLNDFSNRLSLDFINDGKGDRTATFGPEDIFSYMYAVFHCPTYRTRYAEFLKIDFPRLPLTSNPELFRQLCALGDELVGLHLMERTGPQLTRYPVAGDNVVEKVHYTEPGQGAQEGRVWINKTQYFEGVRQEVWDFHIGGYQVCHKWLKDRKGRTLTYEDLDHYQKTVSALSETIRLMTEIDETINNHGGWPLT